VPFFITEQYAMKACWGSGGIVPRIHNLGIKWKRGPRAILDAVVT